MKIERIEALQLSMWQPWFCSQSLSSSSGPLPALQFPGRQGGYPADGRAAS